MGKKAGTAIPIMLHFLIQQVVKQDPAIYCLTVTLQPDYAWWLISYPYFLRDILSKQDTTFNIMQRVVLMPDKDWDYIWKREDIRFFTNKERNTANYAHCNIGVPGYRKWPVDARNSRFKHVWKLFLGTQPLNFLLPILSWSNAKVQGATHFFPGCHNNR